MPSRRRPALRTFLLVSALVLGGTVAAAAGDGEAQPRTLAEIAGMAPTPLPPPVADLPGEHARSVPAAVEAGHSTTTTASPETARQGDGGRDRRRRPPTTTTTSRPPTLEEALLRAALERIKYPWERTGFDIHVAPARRGYLGLTDPLARRIDIYVRRTQTVEDVARTVAHEIGHAVDVTFRTAEDRIRYRAVRGLPDTGLWSGCDGCSDYATPAGDFAEVFAWWLLGPGDYRSRMAPPPDRAQLAELAPLFRPAATRRPG